MFVSNWGHFLINTISIARRNTANNAVINMRPFDINTAYEDTSTTWYAGHKYSWPVGSTPHPYYAVWPMFFAGFDANNQTGAYFPGENASFDNDFAGVGADNLYAGKCARNDAGFSVVDDGDTAKFGFLNCVQMNDGTANYGHLKYMGEADDTCVPAAPHLYNAWQVAFNATLWGTEDKDTPSTSPIGGQFWSMLLTGRTSDRGAPSNRGNRRRRRDNKSKGRR
jgi:hypothetical protein